MGLVCQTCLDVHVVVAADGTVVVRGAHRGPVVIGILLHACDAGQRAACKYVFGC